MVIYLADFIVNNRNLEFVILVSSLTGLNFREDGVGGIKATSGWKVRKQ